MKPAFMQECYDKYVTEEIKELIMKREEKIYSVTEKLPPVNKEVIGFDKDFNSFRCSYDGEVWYFNIGLDGDKVICEQPKFWEYKNMEELL